MTRRAALYVRISTKDGRQDLDNQLLALRQYAARDQMEIVHVFKDEETGSEKTRPGFDRMMEAARRREFDVLLFWSLDRLSREGAYPTLGHLQRLTGYGCLWKSLSEPYIDTLGPFGDAVIGFLATVAKIEKSRISERTRAGLDRARRNGIQLGRNKIILDAKKLYYLHIDGKESIRSLAVKFGVSAGTVRNRIELYATHIDI